MRLLAKRLQHCRLAVHQTVDLSRRHGRESGCRIFAQVHEVQLVNVGTIAPIVLARSQHRLARDFELDELEGPRAVAADPELAVLLRVQYAERVVEQVLRHRELRRLAVQPHGMGVDPLDGVGIPQARGLLRLALVVRLARLVFLEQVALHQSQRGRSGFRFEDALEVPDDVVGSEFAAIAPRYPLADVQGPGLEIVARLP